MVYVVYCSEERRDTKQRHYTENYTQCLLCGTINLNTSIEVR